MSPEFVLIGAGKGKYMKKTRFGDRARERDQRRKQTDWIANERV